jgi:hypothetical protein
MPGNRSGMNVETKYSRGRAPTDGAGDQRDVRWGTQDRLRAEACDPHSENVKQRLSTPHAAGRAAPVVDNIEDAGQGFHVWKTARAGELCAGVVYA